MKELLPPPAPLRPRHRDFRAEGNCYRRPRWRCHQDFKAEGSRSIEGAAAVAPSASPRLQSRREQLETAEMPPQLVPPRLPSKRMPFGRRSCFRSHRHHQDSKAEDGAPTSCRPHPHRCYQDFKADREPGTTCATVPHRRHQDFKQKLPQPSEPRLVATSDSWRTPPCPPCSPLLPRGSRHRPRGATAPASSCHLDPASAAQGADSSRRLHSHVETSVTPSSFVR